jgi:hypothetical protein
MLFQLTSEDHIRRSEEQQRTETDGGRSSFASEQELQELAREWPMKRLVEIWNRLPTVAPITRFTDRKTAWADLASLQPQTDEGGDKPVRRASPSRHRPVFREGSKAAQVCTLLARPQGATLNEIRSETDGRPIRCADSSRAICRNRAGKCARLSATASVCTA